MSLFMLLKRAILPLLAAAACMTSAHAQLPSLEKNEWLGYFAGYEGRDCLFGVSSKAEISIQMVSSKGKSGAGIVPHGSMSILVGIEEVIPNAKPSVRTIREESLETKDKPTEKLEKTVIRGKVTGDATFELTIERERGNFIISNRLIDPGSLTKNEIRPVVVLIMKDLYTHDKQGEPSKAKLKEREKDTLDLKWTDGTRKKFSFSDEMDATLETVNGPGISIAQIEAGGLIRGRQLTLTAADGVSVIRAGNQLRQLLSRGMRFTAMPAPAKPGGKPNDTARLVIGVR
jgi:hypothetical protein